MDNNQTLTLQDILVILDIINVASTRNAFRVEEYAPVGSIFQKLSAIVQTSGVKTGTQDATPTSEDVKND